MTVHDFATSLEKSNKHADAPWWGTVYSQAFPNLQAAHNVRQDGWAQRAGIDRQLVLEDGTILKVDEKVREEAWPDFCLEFWSDTRRRTPGWVAKDLTCDFIAYAFIPTEECYLLPFHLLRRAWRANGRAWVARGREREGGFRIVAARNHGYVTTSVAVPRGVVLSAITEATHVRWSVADAPEPPPSKPPDVPIEETFPDFFADAFDEEVMG